MKLTFGYKDHKMAEKKWYRILRAVFLGVNVIGGIPLYITAITNILNGPKPWLFILTILPIMIIFQVGGILVVRYIFLYTVLGHDKPRE